MSMKTVQPTIANLEEGQLLRDANSAIARVGSHVADFMEHYKGRAAGAKGKLTIEVAFEAINAGDENECINIVTSVKESVPPRPKAVRIAFPQKQDDGLQQILMRPLALAPGEDPNQQHLDFTPSHESATAES